MSYESQIKKLLSNKESMGGEKYAAAIGKLKKKMKADGASFKKTLSSVKKQEREGTFDRGAEDKNKKALRKKMLDKQDGSKRGGVHKGTRADKENELTQRVMDDPEYKAMKKKNKTKTGPGSR